MYYLYVKTHRKTGIRYLGKTRAKDPLKYKGSGVRWLNHIRTHGYDCETTVLLATEDSADIARTGLFFSKLWRVSESKEWANLKDESGDGGWDHLNRRSVSNIERWRANGRRVGKLSAEKTVVIDKTGNRFRVSVNDPRLETGELVGHTKGMLATYDADGKLHYVRRDDERFKTGLLKSNNAGKIYITNGVERKLIRPTADIPEGWWIGDGRKRYNAGKIWATNGVTSQMVFPESIPPGWRRGRSRSS